MGGGHTICIIGGASFEGAHGGERGRRWGALLSRQRCRDPSDTAELRLERMSIGSR